MAVITRSVIPIVLLAISCAAFVLIAIRGGFPGHGDAELGTLPSDQQLERAVDAAFSSILARTESQGLVLVVGRAKGVVADNVYATAYIDRAPGSCESLSVTVHGADTGDALWQAYALYPSVAVLALPDRPAQCATELEIALVNWSRHRIGPAVDVKAILVDQSTASRGVFRVSKYQNRCEGNMTTVTRDLIDVAEVEFPLDSHGDMR